MDATRAVLRRVTQGLAGAIGPRVAGSPADRRAAELLVGEFGAVCPEVHCHEYRFLGWEPGGLCELSIDGVAMPARPAIGCPPTPEEGIQGCLELLGGTTYGLRPAGAGGAAAHLLAYQGPGGRAIPLLWRPLGSIPAGVVDGAAAKLLADAARRRAPVAFVCRSRPLPGSVSWNVEAALPGDPARQIVVVAHYDTVYGSPGANDNAASCAVLPALAARLAGAWSGRRPTLRLLATGAEEIDLQGARCWVRDLLWRGQGAGIRLALNFDSLTWGDRLQIGVSANAESCLPVLAGALADAPVRAYARSWERVRLGEGVDSAVFAAAAVPTLNANTAGDPGTVALWHTPDDTVERMPWARAEDAVEVFGSFLEQLD